MTQLAPPDLRVLTPRTSALEVAAVGDTILPDGAAVFCIDNQSNYRLVRNSTTTVDGLNVLATLSGRGRWVRESSPAEQAAFSGNIELVMDRNSWSIYAGPAAAVSFTVALDGHQEQRVQSYLIPAGTATSVTCSSQCNVNELDAFSAAADYLLVFVCLSGVIVGSGRMVA